MPSQNPMNAGKKAQPAKPADCSMAGINKLHTDAAVMTPGGKTG